MISVAIILWCACILLRDSVNLAVDAVPDGIDSTKARCYLSALPGVVEAHDLHIWALSTTQTALTVHLVFEQGNASPEFIHETSHELKERFDIHYSTIQIEPPGLEECLMSRCDVSERSSRSELRTHRFGEC